MNPYYFSSSETPLYGVYHSPAQMGANEKAILLCPPVGQDYIRTHRAMKFLADQLSAGSCHVFRFDYFGTGDSSGDMQDADITVWQNNIREAATELIDNSGITEIDILAVRFGAALAASVDISVKRFFMWDPVFDGRQYVEEIEKLHTDMLHDNDRFSTQQTHDKNDGHVELLGYMYSNNLIDAIRNTCPENMTLTARQYYLVDSADSGSDQLMRHSILNGINKLETINGDMPASWSELQNLEIAYLPFRLINQVKEVILQG